MIYLRIPDGFREINLFQQIPKLKGPGFIAALVACAMFEGIMIPLLGFL